MPTPPRLTVRHWVFWAIALVIGSTIVARAQNLGITGAPARYEFLNQEVQADTVVESLNDLSKNGWEVFQIIPVWKIAPVPGGDNGLIPKSYQVFARRPPR